MRVFFGNYAPIFIILIKGVVGLVKMINPCSAIMPPTKSAILTILTLPSSGTLIAVFRELRHARGFAPAATIS